MTTKDRAELIEEMYNQFIEEPTDTPLSIFKQGATRAFEHCDDEIAEMKSSYEEVDLTKCRGQEPGYPCQKCGCERTKAEGGTMFTLCDECWDSENRSNKL